MKEQILKVKVTNPYVLEGIMVEEYNFLNFPVREIDVEHSLQEEGLYWEHETKECREYDDLLEKNKEYVRRNDLQFDCLKYRLNTKIGSDHNYKLNVKYNTNLNSLKVYYNIFNSEDGYKTKEYSSLHKKDDYLDGRDIEIKTDLSEASHIDVFIYNDGINKILNRESEVDIDKDQLDKDIGEIFYIREFKMYEQEHRAVSGFYVKAVNSEEKRSDQFFVYSSDPISYAADLLVKQGENKHLVQEQLLISGIDQGYFIDFKNLCEFEQECFNLDEEIEYSLVEYGNTYKPRNLAFYVLSFVVILLITSKGSKIFDYNIDTD